MSKYSLKKLEASEHSLVYICPLASFPPATLTTHDSESVAMGHLLSAALSLYSLEVS